MAADFAYRYNTLKSHKNIAQVSHVFVKKCMEMYAQCSVRSGEVPITCPDGRCPLIQRNRTTVGGHLTRNEVNNKLLQLSTSINFVKYLF